MNYKFYELLIKGEFLDLYTKLKDYIFQFKDYLISEKKLSDNTNYAYYEDVLQFYEYLNEKKAGEMLDYFTLDSIDGYLVWIYKKGLSARSIARKLSSLSLFLKFLKIEKIIEDNPSGLINRPKYSKKNPVYLTLDEIEKLINYFDLTKPEGIRDRTIIELIYSCGLRVSELSDLNVGSVRFKDNLLQVFGKGSKERYVPIGERGLGDLKIYLEKARPALLKNKKTDALFLNYRGERLTRKGIWKNLKTAGKMAGIEKEFCVHSLRHSFATHLIQNGADVRAIQLLLGHKSINTTEIYTHLDLSNLKESYKKYHTHS